MNRLDGAFLVAPDRGEVRMADLAWEGDELLPEGIGGDGEPLDAAGRLVFPGRAALTELSLSLLPGMPMRSGETDGERVERYLRALDAEALSAAARLGALQSVQAGITLVCDLSRARLPGTLDVIAAAVQELGLRGALALDVSDGNQARMEEAVRFHQHGLQGGRFRAMMGIAQASLLQEEQLASAVRAARRAEMAFHLRLGPTLEERGRLFRRGAVRPGSIVVPSAPLGGDEKALIRDLRGFELPPPGPAPEAVSSGADLAAELFDRPFGRFVPGAPADLVVVEAELVAPVTRATLPAHLTAITSRHVKEVVVAGTRIASAGRPLLVEESEVRARAREAVKKLWARA